MGIFSAFVVGACCSALILAVLRKEAGWTLFFSLATACNLAAAIMQSHVAP